MPTYNFLDTPEVQLMLAARTLMQLYRTSFFAKAAVTEYNTEGMFSHGEAISITRPKDSGEAEEYDPRNLAGNAALEQEPGDVKVNLSLDKLFTRGFPVYSTDASAERYIIGYSESVGAALRKSADNYLYNVGFRIYDLTPTGIIQFSKHPPIQIVWGETATGQLIGMNRHHLVRANAVLKNAEVPDEGRYAALSPTSVGDLFGDAPTDEGESGALAGGAGLLSNGLPQGSFINRHGFMVGNSNAIATQLAVSDVSGGNPEVAIASVAADNTFFIQEDLATTTPLGAVRITVTAALSGNLGVGMVVRIGASGVPATAYGVILRIDGNDVYLVPYSAKGQKMVAEQLTPGTDVLSAPEITNLNVAYHQEHLAYAARRLRLPSNNSGATMTPVSDPDSGLTMQMIKGSYDVNRFKESCRMALLMGGVATDHRKSVLMLAA